MRLLEPDAPPDAFGLDRRGKPAEALAQLADLYPEPVVDRYLGWTAASGCCEFVRLGHLETVPNTLLKVFGCVRLIGTEHFPAHAGSARRHGTAQPTPPVPAPTSGGAPRPRDVTRARARRPAQRHHRGLATDAHRRPELTQPRRGPLVAPRVRLPAICATTYVAARSCGRRSVRGRCSSLPRELVQRRASASVRKAGAAVWPPGRPGLVPSGHFDRQRLGRLLHPSERGRGGLAARRDRPTSKAPSRSAAARTRLRCQRCHR